MAKGSAASKPHATQILICGGLWGDGLSRGGKPTSKFAVVFHPGKAETTHDGIDATVIKMSALTSEL